MSILDLEAFDRTPLSTDPCDFVVVEHFVRPEVFAEVVADYPKLDAPGSFDVHALACGPVFSKLIDELESPELAARFSRKFGVDLSHFAQQTGVRRHADPTDGRIHNDSRNKFVTALIYFNSSWTSDGGRLRLLRGRTTSRTTSPRSSPPTGRCWRSDAPRTPTTASSPAKGSGSPCRPTGSAPGADAAVVRRIRGRC